MDQNENDDEAEALAVIKKAAAEGRIVYAPETLAVTLDPEIQRIFQAVMMALYDEEPKGPIWASDESRIGDVLDWEGGAVSDKSRVALTAASEKLGIPLAADDLFVDAAMLLRGHERKSPDEN